MPEGFDFPRGTDLWTPVVPVLVKDWGTDALAQVGALFAIGRLRAAVTPTMAAEELTRLSESVEQRTSHPRFRFSRDGDTVSRLCAGSRSSGVVGVARRRWRPFARGVREPVGPHPDAGLITTPGTRAVLVALGATRGLSPDAC